MSEHATTAPAVPFGEQAVTLPGEPVERTAVETPADRGRDLPLAAIFFTIVLGLYAAVASALYMLVTSLT